MSATGRPRRCSAWKRRAASRSVRAVMTRPSSAGSPGRCCARRPRDRSRMREAVRVGDAALLGEVVRIDGDEIVAQVYEDTTGLRPGAHRRRRRPAALDPARSRIARPHLRRTAAPARGRRYRVRAAGDAPCAPQSFAFVPRVRRGETLARRRDHRRGHVAPAGIVQRCLAPPERRRRSRRHRRPPANTPTTRSSARVRDAEGRERPLSMSHTWPVRDAAAGRARGCRATSR